MDTLRKPLLLVSAILIGLCASPSFGAKDIGRPSPSISTIEVNGNITEDPVSFHGSAQYGLKVVAMDTVTGDLAGAGLLQIQSAEVNGENATNVISTRTINTTNGHIFLAEVGEHIGADITVHSTVIGGTGLYKGVTGTLLLTGTHTPTGILFSYSGTLNLVEKQH